MTLGSSIACLPPVCIIVYDEGMTTSTTISGGMMEDVRIGSFDAAAAYPTTLPSPRMLTADRELHSPRREREPPSGFRKSLLNPIYADATAASGGSSSTTTTTAASDSSSSSAAADHDEDAAAAPAAATTAGTASGRPSAPRSRR